MIRSRRVLAVAARLALGAVFVYAGIAKLDAPAPFAASIAMLQLVPFARIDWLAAALPIAEVLTGAWLIAGWRPGAAALAAMLLAGVFLAAVGQAMWRDLPFNCQCFGFARESPPAWFVFVRALALLTTALLLRRMSPSQPVAVEVTRPASHRPTQGLVTSIATGLLALGFALGSSPASAAVWQWSVEIPGAPSPETNAAPRAFLWIPENCARVRAVVIAQHNMEEEPILEHATFRAALRDLGFAAVWITPPLDPVFRFDQGAGERFDAMLRALADESGYDEIASAPVVPMGHSAAASFPWNFAAWAPQRTLAAISISGQWPIFEDKSMPPWGDRSIDGVPGLVTMGEYEWADERAVAGLKQRNEHPRWPLTMLSEAGGGHFDVSDEKVTYLALYLRKAAQHRLAPETSGGKSAPLRALDPTTTGWFVDRWRADEPPRVPAAPIAEYAEPEEAFWCFDEEHAIAAERFRANQRGKKVALLGYVQSGAVLPQVAGTHQQVTIPFAPLDDGLTFKLSGAWLDTVPKGRPERWTGLTEGATVTHPASSADISIDRICGPVEKLSADTFALRFYRMGLNNRKRTGEIWLAATHPGDAEFKRSVQQAVLRFPLQNTEGPAQTISFAPLANQKAGAAPLALRATSNAPDAKVHFYVREGPAEIKDGTLTLSALPPRTKFPVRVTVVAWQWGRSIEPKLQSAEPIERSFLITP